MPSKSKCWQHFARVPEGGKCNLCSKIVISKGGSTTNLFTHLRRVHKLELTPHKSVAGKSWNDHLNEWPVCPQSPVVKLSIAIEIHRWLKNEVFTLFNNSLHCIYVASVKWIGHDHSTFFNSSFWQAVMLSTQLLPNSHIKWMKWISIYISSILWYVYSVKWYNSMWFHWLNEKK